MDGEPQITIQIIKDWAETLQAALTSLGILCAGWWALRQVRKQRQWLPHANVEHRLTHWPAGEVGHVLRVSVRISNVGNVVTELCEIRTDVQQLEPIPLDVAALFARGETGIAASQSEVPWGTLSQRICKWPDPEDRREIEPGETDEYHFDFVMPGDVTRIAAYSYVTNVRKRRDVGWGVTTVYSFENRRAIDGEVDHDSVENGRAAAAQDCTAASEEEIEVRSKDVEVTHKPRSGETRDTAASAASAKE